jgi:hypothetical protein
VGAQQPGGTRGEQRGACGRPCAGKRIRAGDTAAAPRAGSAERRTHLNAQLKSTVSLAHGGAGRAIARGGRGALIRVFGWGAGEGSPGCRAGGRGRGSRLICSDQGQAPLLTASSSHGGNAKFLARMAMPAPACCGRALPQARGLPPSPLSAHGGIVLMSPTISRAAGGAARAGAWIVRGVGLGQRRASWPRWGAANRARAPRWRGAHGSAPHHAAARKPGVPGARVPF